MSRDKYPKLNEDQLRALSMTAANEWYMGIDSELATLFDQYVMIKRLKETKWQNS